MTHSLLARIAILALAWVSAMQGCSVPPEQRAPEFIHGNVVWSAPSTSSKSSVAPTLPTLNFGIGPWLSPRRMQIAYQALLDHLEHHTGHRFILNMTPDYGTLVDDLKAGRLDLAILPSSAYADTLDSDSSGLHYLVTSTRPTSTGASTPFYYGYIVTQLNSPMMNLSDLKGKRFGFVDRKSSSGYRFPLATLLSAGIVPHRDFKRVVFLGSHDRIATALSDGTIDAGAIWDEAYDQLTSNGKNPMRVLSKTSPIPEEAWVAGSTIKEKLRVQLTETLLSVTPETTSPSGTPLFRGDLRKTGHKAQGSSFYEIMNETKRTVLEYEQAGKTGE